MRLDGIHHVEIQAADASASLGFYAGLLGLKPLRREPGRVWLGAPGGPPGNLVSLSPAPGAAPRRTGAGSVHTIIWRLGSDRALAFWRRRLAGVGVAPAPDFGGLRIVDPDGVGHELVVDPSDDEPLCTPSADVPLPFALRGIEGVRAFGRELVATADLLAGRLGFDLEGDGRVFRVRGYARSASLVFDEPPGGVVAAGTGPVRHVAWTCGADEQAAWRQRVIGLGARLFPLEASPHFRSIAFREPSGVPFAISTAGPGFEAPVAVGSEAGG
ncbi:MAG TPA: VOC family protein [Solirubrobacterales bacterium]|nr:VOC family protein [Solirubrobacterales bacterium]